MLSFEYNPELALKVACEEAREDEKENTTLELLKAGVAMNVIIQATKLSTERIIELGKLNGIL